MQRSKINFNSKTKLANLTQEEKEFSNLETLNLLNNKAPAVPISFRLRKVDSERLDAALKKINECNESHPFNKADLIKGLIMLATEMEPKKTLGYIRKSI